MLLQYKALMRIVNELLKKQTKNNKCLKLSPPLPQTVLYLAFNTSLN